MTAEQNPNPTTLHHTLVDHLVDQQAITSPAVEAAFRAVRREHFLPDLPPELVYKDDAIVTQVDQAGQPTSSSSSPPSWPSCSSSFDLPAGPPRPEIGAGNGYNAALIAHIVGEQGRAPYRHDAGLVEAACTTLAAAG